MCYYMYGFKQYLSFQGSPLLWFLYSILIVYRSVLVVESFVILSKYDLQPPSLPCFFSLCFSRQWFIQKMVKLPIGTVNPITMARCSLLGCSYSHLINNYSYSRPFKIKKVSQRILIEKYTILFLINLYLFQRTTMTLENNKHTLLVFRTSDLKK